MNLAKHVSIEFTINMLSDFHVGSGTSIVGLADRAVLRTASKELLIPGSAIKGRARHHCEQLARSWGLRVCGGRASDAELCKGDAPPCLICCVFGSEWRPGSLRFSDARLPESLRNVVLEQGSGLAEFDYQVTTHARTRVNRMLRKVEQGALYTFEEGSEGLAFDARITGSLRCIGGAQGLPLEALALLASLRLVERLGGKKTIGLGECALNINKLEFEGEDQTASWQDALARQLEGLVLYDLYRAG